MTSDDLYDFIEYNKDSRKYILATTVVGGINTYDAQKLELSLMVRKDVDHCRLEVYNGKNELINSEDFPVNGAGQSRATKGLAVYGWKTPGPGSDGGGWIHTQDWFNLNTAVTGPTIISDTSAHGFAGMLSYPGWRSDYFSMRVLGTVLPHVSGEYILGFNSIDDGAFITFDHLIGYNRWGSSHTLTVTEGTPIYLHANQPYDFTFDYFERGGEHFFDFYWRRPDGVQEPIGATPGVVTLLPERITYRANRDISVPDADTYKVVYRLWNNDGTEVVNEVRYLTIPDRTPAIISSIKANLGFSIKPFVDSKLKGTDIIINSDGTRVTA